VLRQQLPLVPYEHFLPLDLPVLAFSNPILKVQYLLQPVPPQPVALSLLEHAERYLAVL